MKIDQLAELTQEEIPTTDAVVDETPVPGRGDQGLPDNMQLMLGTFLLEDTDEAVTSEQAAELVILWKAFRTLSTSDNVAVEEMEALLRQVQDTMTTLQMDTIAGMEVTQEDMFTLIQELGIVSEDIASIGRGEGEGEGLPDGGFPGGGFPGGGGSQGPGGQGPGAFSGEFDPDAIATARAERGGGPGLGARFNSFLLDPLIELLESKIST